eukprot:tig00020830_g14486.t1
MGSVFSVAAFFIALRETAEICLVVGILLGHLEKTGNQKYKRDVWIGTGLGVAVSIIIGIAFGVLKYQQNQQLFAGKNAYVFEGITFLIAMVFVSYMILWSMKNARNLAAEMAKAVTVALDKNSRWSMISLAFLQVVKEGIEIVLLVIGGSDADDPKRVPLPGICGILAACVVSYFFFRGSLKLNIRQFFFWSNALLMLFAAGLSSRAFHELQEADWFGLYDNKGAGLPVTAKPWWNQKLWDISWAAHKKNNGFFTMLRYLFGYTDSPTFLEFIAYFGYWAILGGFYLYVYRDEIFDKDTARSGRKRTFYWGLYIWCNVIVGLIVCGGGDERMKSWNGELVCALWLAVTTLALLPWALSIFPATMRTFSKHATRVVAWVVFGGALVSFLITMALNIADLAEVGPPTGPRPALFPSPPRRVRAGLRGRAGGVQRFFYWMLVWDWSFCVSYKIGTYIASITLLSISLFLNLAICGGFTLSSWSYARSLSRVEQEGEGELDGEASSEGANEENYVAKGADADVELGKAPVAYNYDRVPWAPPPSPSASPPPPSSPRSPPPFN